MTMIDKHSPSKAPEAPNNDGETCNHSEHSGALIRIKEEYDRLGLRKPRQVSEFAAARANNLLLTCHVSVIIDGARH